MKRNAGALRRHPQLKTPLRLAAGLLFQIFSWQVSRLVDRGRFRPDMIEINPFELELPRLAPIFDGFRIVHISDLHMGTWMNAERLSGIVDLINTQQADLVAITGDFVSYTIEQPLKAILEPLKRIRASDGRFGVLGNHDVWTDPDSVRTMLSQSGIRELRNQAFTLRRNGSCLHICGVDNAYENLADLAPILDALPQEGAAVLLAHEPDFADRSAATGRFDLQLSGHSHGGQFNLPLVGPPFLPYMAKKYPRGHYRIGEMLLYTTRGLGTTALQMRFRCPPEIAVITLRSKDLGARP